MNARCKACGNDITDSALAVLCLQCRMKDMTKLPSSRSTAATYTTSSPSPMKVIGGLIAIVPLVYIVYTITAGIPPIPERVPAPIATQTLPPHVVADDSSLAPKRGRRIQLNSSDPKLTKDECTALINGYRVRAIPDGQVSVHKPSPKWDGSMTPWCVENFDGRGIVFQDSMF